MNSPRLMAVLCVSLLAASCGSKKDAAQTAGQNKPVAVSTAAAEVRETPAGFDETGTFLAEESSNVAPHAPGRVIATPVDVGARVAKDQVICELEHRDAELRLEQARAQYEQATAALRQAQQRIGYTKGSFDAEKVPEVAAAKAAYESAQAQARLAAADAKRYENLVATGDVSKSAYERVRTAQETADAAANLARQQYEAAANTARQSYEVVSTQQASMEAAKTAVAIAEKGLADTTIRAPYAGFVTARPVSVGEYVSTDRNIATVVDISTLKLDLQTPEQRASQAHVGDKVIAHVDAFPDRAFEGKVIAVNPSVDPNSRVFILRAEFSNPDAALKPGMFATARVALPGGVQAVFVPAQAVIRDKTTDSNQIYVAENGKARLRVVGVGDKQADRIQVINGLKGGEQVITSGLSDLYDGAVLAQK